VKLILTQGVSNNPFLFSGAILLLGVCIYFLLVAKSKKEKARQAQLLHPEWPTAHEQQSLKLFILPLFSVLSCWGRILLALVLCAFLSLQDSYFLNWCAIRRSTFL
jgi:hypothetical protein